jgi:hypothetical protein
LVATEVTFEQVTLQWEKPESDGSSEVTSYVVVMREMEKTKYKKAGQVDGTTLTLVTDKVKSGLEYSFRVYAENSIGMSETFAETETSIKVPKKEAVVKVETKVEEEATTEDASVSITTSVSQEEVVEEEVKVEEDIKTEEEITVEAEIKSESEAPVQEEVRLELLFGALVFILVFFIGPRSTRICRGAKADVNRRGRITYTYLQSKRYKKHFTKWNVQVGREVDIEEIRLPFYALNNSSRLISNCCCCILLH